MTSGEASQDHQITVPDKTKAGRADKVMARLCPDLSRTRWQKLFLAGHVWREDRALSQTDRLFPGDSIEYTIPPLEPLELLPVAMDLSILYEDEAILVLNKAAGVVVHPGAGTGADTLVHGLLHHCQDSLSGIGGTERPGIVHRLDKETSGVLIVAKSDIAFSSLTRQFAEREVEKYYLALVTGRPAVDQGTVDEPIGRHGVHRTRMTCREDGRHAKTDYLLEHSWGGVVSRIRLQIHTGRTHQIRVHMKQLGHPVLGDSLYGYKEKAALDIPRVMLHAARLVIRHPVSDEPMQFEAPLPDDFTGVMEKLGEQFGDAESH